MTTGEHVDGSSPTGATSPARHPDVFTAEEAAAYLRLPSVRAFNRRRRELGVKGLRAGRAWLFSRATLDANEADALRGGRRRAEAPERVT